jgi:DUF4097 and DUF4098 domain-containing protein YvlB
MLLAVVFFLFAVSTVASAQKRFSRTYPAGQDVRLQLINKTGTVTVEGWNRQEVAISASMEAPAATIAPQSLSDTIVINLLKDNQGRDTGNVNFVVRVPYNTKVDIETRIGNLQVSNVRSGLVRAHISSEGDIILTNIYAKAVAAENGIGDIFFDGEIQENGAYRFTSMKGNIAIRIPFTSSFKLQATAPSSRNITLGAFDNANLNRVSDGRRVIGTFNGGSATVNIVNQRGSIGFFSR